MNKHAKLAILLSASWFVIVCAMSQTRILLRGYPHELTDFLTYLFAGLALINLAIWGYRWITAAD